MTASEIAREARAQATELEKRAKRLRRAARLLDAKVDRRRTSPDATA